VPKTEAIAPLASSAPALLEADSVIGVIEKIDRGKRTLSLKTTTGLKEFSFRDDTMFLAAAASVGVRLDEYVERNSGSLPFAEEERVRVRWRKSATTGKDVATHVAVWATP
jgi:hypothetical protein